jgi:hypothetical protein
MNEDGSGRPDDPSEEHHLWERRQVSIQCAVGILALAVCTRQSLYAALHFYLLSLA